MDEEEISKAIELPVSDEDPDDIAENEINDFTPAQNNDEERVTQDLSNLSLEMLSAFKIVDSLVNPNNKSVNLPFMNAVEENGKNYRNYYQVIKKPMWLMKIYNNILAEEYSSIREVVADLRIVLENCYRYYGQNHPYIKKGLKLETILEQKLALLPSNLREQTVLEATSPRLATMFLQLKEHSQQQGASQQGLTGVRANSAIYQCVREEKAQKERERKRELMEMRRAEREAAHQETLHWEEALLAEHASDIRKMWELPQIGHFLYLAQKTLNLPEVSQYELERSVFMPTGSSLMATIMTSLLSTPHQRAKLDQWPAMLHKTWENRLKLRVQHWYKVYTSKERNLLKVFELIGIEPEFFRIMGDSNPMEAKTFQELTLKQKVWVLKSLCDYCLHNHKTVQDSIMEVSYEDQHESQLGEDRDGNVYVHFPQFCGQSLRIYRMTKDMDIPELDLTPPTPAVESNPSVKAENVAEDGKEIKEEDNLAGGDGTSTNNSNNNRRNNKRKGRRRKTKKVEEKPAKPQPPTFELVVESVEALRNLMDCFVEAEPRNTRRQPSKGGKGGKELGQPYCEKMLHKRLQNLLLELEPWEQKLEQAIIRSRLKLKKEWEDKKMKDAKAEEEVDNFWDIETEEEVPQVNLESSSTSLSDYEDDANASEFRQTHQRTCTRRKRVWESNAESSSSESESEPFKITVSSRGRVCKMRNFNFVPAAEKPASTPSNTLAVKKEAKKISTKPATVTLNGIQPKQRDMLESHRSKNSASDAQIQYQWETMRLKLLKASETEKITIKPEQEDKTKDVKKSVLTKAHKPAENESVLDNEVFLKAGPDFGSWKSSVPGSAFTEQTFSTLLERSVSYTSPPPVPSRPPPPKKLEIVKLSVPPPNQAHRLSISHTTNNIERPRLGIFRDKNITGNDKRCVKTTFAAPGILRTTISKRPTQTESGKASPQASPVKPVQVTLPATTTSTSTMSTPAALIPSLSRPGQKILVLPIKNASGNKVLLQVVPKGSQPLKLSQFKGITNVVNKRPGESKILLPNNISYRLDQQPTKTIGCNKNRQVILTQTRGLLTNQNQQVVNNQNQQIVSSNNQTLLPNQSQQISINENQQLVSNQELNLGGNQAQAFLNASHPLRSPLDPLLQAVRTQILQSSVSQDLPDNPTLHSSTLTQDIQVNQMLPSSVSQEMTSGQIMHSQMSQDLSTSQLLPSSVSQEVLTNQILQTSVVQDMSSNQILHSPPHEHFSPNQNLSPPTSQLLTTPTNHSQLIHTIQSTNPAQILASTLATQNQVLQTSPNQILTSVNPVLTNPDGSVTLLTQGSAGTVVLPVQTHIYAPQLYASSEPKVIVCANGQVLDGNVGQENLFVVTSGGQLVSMDNCTFQQAVLTEQMSPL